jgi:hypothetical protein
MKKRTAKRTMTMARKGRDPSQTANEPLQPTGFAGGWTLAFAQMSHHGCRGS